jgi:cobalamin biosynthesis Co2+ chelatase CbiK
MTIIFSNHLDEDSRTITSLWRNFKDYKLIEILPDTKDADYIVDKAIEQEDDTLILIGHGTTHGLLHPNFRGEYLIHEYNVNLIHAKRVICMWCYASTFCENNHLHCFASSMFISNVQEAYDNCIYDVNQEQINSYGRLFYAQLADLIENDVPMQDWVMRLGCLMDIENPVDIFNRQGLWYN